MINIIYFVLFYINSCIIQCSCARRRPAAFDVRARTYRVIRSYINPLNLPLSLFFFLTQKPQPLDLIKNQSTRKVCLPPFVLPFRVHEILNVIMIVGSVMIISSKLFYITSCALRRLPAFYIKARTYRWVFVAI
jgi:hypothetical protein